MISAVELGAQESGVLVEAFPARLLSLLHEHVAVFLDRRGQHAVYPRDDPPAADLYILTRAPYGGFLPRLG